MKITLEAVKPTAFLTHQGPTTARQALENVVFLRRGGHFLRDILGQGQVVAELEELQTFARIEGIGFGRTRKEFLEPGQLQVLHVIKTVVTGSNHRIQGAGIAIDPFHRHRDRTAYWCS